MPMDGLTIHSQIYEFNELLAGARVDKINQPEEDEIILFLFNKGKNYKLLLCSNASFPRVNITSMQKNNSPVPPAFCMLLRKHLSGSHIIEFTQPGNERIINIVFESLNEFNEPEKKTLTVEIMGKYSNIILVNHEGKILDSVRRVNSLMSRMRCIQPGLKYELPPSQGKQNPFESDFQNVSSARMIFDTFVGISKQSAEEIAYIAESVGYEKAFEDYISNFKNNEYAPILQTDENGEPLDFYPLPQSRILSSFQKRKETVSEAIDEYYLLKDKYQRVKERSKEIRTKLQNILDKAEKKKVQQEEKLLECSSMEKYRIYGELLTANIYLIKRGAPSVTVLNYYTNENEEIPLDVTLSPNANAQKYFKTYNKLKTASKLLSAQMEENEKEIDLVNDMLECLEKCESQEDINDIRNEMCSLGYIKAAKTKQKQEESKSMHFISSEGIDIYVGKNNIQNDKLTMHFAFPTDLWLHTKDTHGSHVIIHGENYSDKTVQEAAELAVYYSKGRNAALVPVDATKKKFVKKPSGSAPGKVIYTNQTTYYITVDGQSIKRIKRI